MRKTMKMAEKTVEFILVIWRGSGSTGLCTGLAEGFILEIRSRPILATLAPIRTGANTHWHHCGIVRKRLWQTALEKNVKPCHPTGAWRFQKKHRFEPGIENIAKCKTSPGNWGVRYPIWFNSMFEFCQKMIPSIFDSILLTQDSIQNIIQFKIKLWKRKTLVIQFNKIFVPLENQGIV